MGAPPHGELSPTPVKPAGELAEMHEKDEIRRKKPLRTTSRTALL